MHINKILINDICPKSNVVSAEALCTAEEKDDCSSPRKGSNIFAKN